MRICVLNLKNWAAPNTRGSWAMSEAPRCYSNTNNKFIIHKFINNKISLQTSVLQNKAWKCGMSAIYSRTGQGFCNKTFFYQKMLIDYDWNVFVGKDWFWQIFWVKNILEKNKNCWNVCFNISEQNILGFKL